MAVNENPKETLELLHEESEFILFARQVLTTGRLVYVENSGLRNLWEDWQNSKYFDFKIDRGIIEKNLQNMGKS